MNMRLFVLGFLVFLLGIGLEYISVQGILSGIPGYVSAAQSIAVRPNSSFSVPIAISNLSILQIAYNASLPLNFYLMNNSAYTILKPAFSGNSLIENASALEGKGVLFILNGSSHGTFPYVQNLTLSQRPLYAYNATVVANGTYYAVFQNYGNKTGSVFYTVLNRSISSLSESEKTLSYGNIFSNFFGVAFFVAGIVAMFYALFTRSNSEERVDDEEVKKQFERIERTQRGRGRKGRALKRTEGTVYIKGRKRGR